MLAHMQPRTVVSGPRQAELKGTKTAQPARVKMAPLRAYVEQKQAGESASASSQFANQLEALKSMSTVVADTGEPDLVKKYKPIDCTTNPSLVYKAVQQPEYRPFLDEAVAAVRANSNAAPDPRNRPAARVADALSVIIGRQMLDIVPGRVSTEVDASLSYNEDALYDKAMELVDMYAARGVQPDRLYIKLASTWEGIKACERLQKQGIDCNMTLLFSFAQAAACADVGAALISPFVGRIMDWYKAKEGRSFEPHEDPGVASVQRIYKYYKAHNISTIVMAASFRNAGEIRELAGCDKITISPALLAELEASTEPLPRKLWPDVGPWAHPHSTSQDSERLEGITREQFEKMHNADEMAVAKLKEGIEGFEKDQAKLEEQLVKLLGHDGA